MNTKPVEFGKAQSGIIEGSGSRGPVILTHGAGKGMDSSLLVKTSQRLAGLGFVVLRFNFLYLLKRSAPSMGGKTELPELLSAIAFMQEYGAPVLIGKSFGARVAANAALESADVRAAVFYGMPLRGASKTAKPRDWSHLGQLTMPLLFITGDRDALCPRDELKNVIESIRAPVTAELVPGDHSYKPKSEDLAVEICAKWVDALAHL